VQELRQRIASLKSDMTPAFVERIVRELLQGKDARRGVDALGMVMSLLGDAPRCGDEINWAYARLKPALVAAVGQIPSLRFLDGE
jgi:hypothetical protein